MNENPCLFCKIVSGTIPAEVVHRDEQVTAFRDTNPQAPIHILIIPNRHISSLSALHDQDAAAASSLMLAAARVAVQEGIAEDGYRVVINTGAEAGQTVFHLHLHLLGGRRLRWPPG
jgi:histidine triad (HIT) family protein